MGKKKNKSVRRISQTVDHNYNQDIYNKINMPRNIRVSPVEINPKNKIQEQALDNLEFSKVNFLIGETGSGKTTLAALKALDYYQRRLVKKIVIIRPYIEAGEDKGIGLLKGTMLEKMYPYSRSVLDPIIDAVGDKRIVNEMIEQEIIELLPLVFARGRNLNDSFILLDEVQNATLTGLDLVMTRVGSNAKLVVMGDDDQIDLLDKSKSCIYHIKPIFNDLFLNDPSNFSITEFDSFSNNVRSEVSRKSATAITQYKEKNLPPIKIIRKGL